MMDINELTEQELITLEGLVRNQQEWGLLQKFFKREIARFWDAVRLTDPCDEKRVVTNQKLAVGVEASLGDIIREMEEVYKARMAAPQAGEDIVIDDQTKTLYQ